MKIFVLNLTGRRASLAFVSISLVLVILIAGTIGAVTHIYGDEILDSAADTLPYEKIIIIDAGHGGEDSGAVGVTGVLEKDLNLQIALEIGRIFEEKGYIVINDPSCGAGATLIAAANTLREMGVNYQTSVLFTGNDIDPVVAKMCYIQLSLLGCPGYIAVANTLTDPVVGDVLMPIEKETQDFWYTPMFCSDIWVMRRKCKVMDNFLRS